MAVHENLVNKIKIFLRARSPKGMDWRKRYKRVRNPLRPLE